MNWLVGIGTWVKSHMLVSVIISVVVVGSAVATPIIVSNIQEQNKPQETERQPETNKSNEEQPITCEDGYELVDNECVKIEDEKEPEVDNKPQEQEKPVNNDNKTNNNTSNNSGNKPSNNTSNNNSGNNNNKPSNNSSNNNSSGDSGAMGDASCSIDPNSKECKDLLLSEEVNKHIRYTLDGSGVPIGLSYDGKEMFSQEDTKLENWYENISCGSWCYIQTYKFNKSVINSIPKTQLKYIYENNCGSINDSNSVYTLKYYDEVIAAINKKINKTNEELAMCEKCLALGDQWINDEACTGESNWSWRIDNMKTNLLPSYKRDLEKMTNIKKNYGELRKLIKNF